MRRHGGRAGWAAGVALLVLVGLSPLGGQAPAGARGLIWEVERDGRVGWLVGSLHVLTAEHHPLPATLESAFERATTLVEEVDTADPGDPQMLAAVMARGLYPPGDALDRHVPPDLWALVAERATRTGLGVETVRRMRPWLAGLTLVALDLQRAGFDPEHGIDRYFRRLAANRGTTFVALETAREQIEYLAGFPPAVQEDLLRSSLEDAALQIREVEALVAAWRTGDVAALEGLLLEAFRTAPEVYETLLVQRNRRWLPTLDACLAEAGCFIVVGAGHMVGDEGLVALLRERGYIVRQQ